MGISVSWGRVFKKMIEVKVDGSTRKLGREVRLVRLVKL